VTVTAKLRTSPAVGEAPGLSRRGSRRITPSLIPGVPVAIEQNPTNPLARGYLSLEDA
jgi:hypothetical protein